MILPWKRHRFVSESSAPAEPGYRYFRITVDSNFGGTSRIGEAYILSGATEYPTVAMTSDSSPVPLVASASTFGATFEPFKAFDKSAANQWRMQTGEVAGWVQIDLGAGNEITPTGLRLVFSVTNAGNAQAGKLQASNDGSTWTDILSYNRGTLGNAVLDQTFNI